MLGKLKVTSSVIEFSISIDMSNSSSNFFITSSTNMSGTDAPEEIEITDISLNSSKLREFASGIKTAFFAPNLRATSTSLLELEELSAPTMIKYSVFPASFLTAFCLLVVA